MIFLPNFKFTNISKCLDVPFRDRAIGTGGAGGGGGGRVTCP